MKPDQKRRWHAMHARRLIAACGGLDESAGVCRVQKSQLSDYQSPHVEAFMPADVMADLEAYAGEPIYSRALVGELPEAAPVCLTEEVCDVVESAADLQRQVRRALADGSITPAEREALQRSHADLLAELAQVGAELARGA
ncbi:phage regulatory CII family protein [Phenylobacterium sp.]|uniref:phage regulatory CII family protein n=1 Tax=Phenylobacterium sp. TaxID=1871053 RepID=UPI00273121D4|nr:phage regulatory CII family protein [Phenylobacterium sp.]MDP1875662.1 hypothetical protein [Phenylobacterium sp.]